MPIGDREVIAASKDRMNVPRRGNTMAAQGAAVACAKPRALGIAANVAALKGRDNANSDCAAPSGRMVRLAVSQGSMVASHRQRSGLPLCRRFAAKIPRLTTLQKHRVT